MDEFMMYLEDERVHLEAKEAELKTADRRDEGSMEKVKSNIYGMCLAIYRTVVRQSALQEIRRRFLSFRG